MSQQTDIDTIRNGFAAFARGDMETLRNEVFAPDAVWLIPGTGYYAGPKEGVEAILQFFADLFERSGGTLQVILDDAVAGDDHTISLSHNLAMRGDMSLDQKSVIVYEMLDSRVTRAEQYYDDTAYNDRFWA